MNSDYKYEIIENFISISEKNGYSIQLNLVKWNGNAPKYDLRRWKDGKPLKGFSLSEESFRQMCIAISGIAKEYDLKNENVGEQIRVESSNDSEAVELFGGLSKRQIISLLSNSELVNQNTKIKDVIDNKPILNILKNYKINTLLRLLSILENGSFSSMNGYTPLREKRIYTALSDYIKILKIDLMQNQEDTKKTQIRALFLNIKKIYYQMPIDSVLMLTSKPAAVNWLKKSGYNCLYDLKGIREEELERIIGKDRIVPFLEMDELLASPPEEVLKYVWNKRIDTREGQIVRRRAEGKTLQEIADEDGVVREFVKRLIPRFFIGQAHVLEIIKKQIDASGDYEDCLEQLFPERAYRCYYKLWDGVDEELTSNSSIDGLSTENTQQLTINDFFFEPAKSMKIIWDKYEAALIVDMFYKIKGQEIKRVDGANIISNRLREYGQNREIPVDDKYRNLNGILMQFNAIEYADTNGLRGFSSCSKLFKNTVDLYKNKRAEFDTLLKQANEIIPFPDMNVEDDIDHGCPINSEQDCIERIIAVMDEFFAYGIKTNSPIALMRFKRFYADKFSDELSYDDEELYKIIKSFCFEVDGKLYHVSASDKKFVDRLLGHISDEYNIVYYDRLFELHSDELMEHGVLSPDILKTLIDELISNEGSKKAYFVFDNNGRLSEIRCITDEICRVWGDAKTRDNAYLIEKLPYIPEEKIKHVLAQSDSFLWNSTEEYTQTVFVIISDHEKEMIFDQAKELCEMNESVSFDELDLEKFINDNFELSETAVFNYVFDKILSPTFSRSGRMIRFATTSDDVAELFHDYCREKKHYTLNELYSKWEEITGDNRRAYPIEYGMKYLVRINEDEFVSDDSVAFDVEKTDEVLMQIIPNGYIGMKEITSFAAFPDCGYAWNLYLIESFCRKKSKKFKFLTKIANSKNAGAIVKANMTDDYDELLVDAIANSNIDIEAEQIFEYLIDNGYLSRRAYKNMDQLIYRATELRERSI